VQTEQRVDCSSKGAIALNTSKQAGTAGPGRPLTRADVELLRSKVDSPARLDLSHQNLEKINLTYFDLQGTNLRGADLHDADLRGANLSGADLRSTNLSGADLDGADLSYANLGDSELNRVDLHDANLRYTNLRELDLRGFDLTGLDLRNANLSGTDLRNARMYGTDLRGADLSEARLHGTDLHGAKLFRDVHIGGGLSKTEPDKIKLHRLALEESNETLHSSSLIRIRVMQEPLTARSLAALLTIFTELHTKSWLIQQGRFADCFEYTRTKNSRFEEEAHLLITEQEYNVPAAITFNLDLSPKRVVEALALSIDAIRQAPHRGRSVELDNLEHDSDIGHERARQKLEEERLELETKHKELALETAVLLVDRLHPGADASTKATLIESLVPTVLQLSSNLTWG
jgi:uncharacterized protein YjbI with pentapeptide repeats